MLFTRLRFAQADSFNLSHSKGDKKMRKISTMSLAVLLAVMLAGVMTAIAQQHDHPGMTCNKEGCCKADGGCKDCAACKDGKCCKDEAACACCKDGKCTKDCTCKSCGKDGKSCCKKQ